MHTFAWLNMNFTFPSYAVNKCFDVDRAVTIKIRDGTFCSYLSRRSIVVCWESRLCSFYNPFRNLNLSGSDV